MQALSLLAKESGIELSEYKTKYNRDYQRYDDYILGWTYYFNKTKGWNIDPEVIKAMMYIESHIGYSEMPSPNANIKNDVMQVLDPRNPAVYAFANVDPKGGSAIKVDDGNGNYIILNTLDSAYTPTKWDGSYYVGVANRLFKKNGAFYEYQYDKSSPVLSTGLGIYYYGIILEGSKSRDPFEAAKNYNGSPQHKQAYMNRVKAIVNAGGANVDNWP